ncbi:MAG: hypothetical protein WCX65_17225 [bacterium]
MMRELDVIILDITRMKDDRIGVSGVYKDPELGYCSIRPVPPAGTLRVNFLRRGSGIVEPFTIMRFKFTGTVQNPPHVEDFVFEDKNPGNAVIVGKIEDSEKQRLMSSISKQFLNEIHGKNMVDNKYIYEGGEGRSLGCLKIYRVSKLYIEDKDGKSVARIGFKYKDVFLSLKVAERRLYEYIGGKVAEGADLEMLRYGIEERLREAHPVFMRLGLSRPFLFEDDPDKRKKCYLQILGIHTFPDYLLPVTY